MNIVDPFFRLRAFIIARKEVKIRIAGGLTPGLRFVNIPDTE